MLHYEERVRAVIYAKYSSKVLLMKNACQHGRARRLRRKTSAPENNTHGKMKKRISTSGHFSACTPPLLERRKELKMFSLLPFCKYSSIRGINRRQRTPVNSSSSKFRPRAPLPVCVHLSVEKFSPTSSGVVILGKKITRRRRRTCVTNGVLIFFFLSFLRTPLRPRRCRRFFFLIN